VAYELAVDEKRFDATSMGAIWLLDRSRDNHSYCRGRRGYM